MPELSLRCTAFAGTRRIASGELRHVALKARHAFASGGRVLVFEDASGRQLDLPLELPEGELLRQLAAPMPTHRSPRRRSSTCCPRSRAAEREAQHAAGRAALGQAQPPMPFQAASPSSVHCFFHTGRPRLISSMRVRQI